MRVALVTLTLALTPPVVAQEVTVPVLPPSPAANLTRIDQVRQELIDLIERVEKERVALDTERDTRYAQRFEAQQSAISSNLAAAKEAVDKSEAATEKRFVNVNEFRQTLTDQAATFAVKDTVDKQFQSLDDKINGAIARLDAIKNISEGVNNSWSLILAAIGGVALVGGIVIGVLSLRRPTERVVK